MPYTGNLMKDARYPTTRLAPGPVDPGHTAGREEDNPSPFGGGTAPVGPDWGNPGLWVAPEEAAPQSGAQPNHGGHMGPHRQPLVNPRIGWVDSQRVAADQMLTAHGCSDASTAQQQPEVPRFQFQGQGNVVERRGGQHGWEEGMSGPLARGPNVYGQNNPPTEVYDGAGMRYGFDTITFGNYITPHRFERNYRIRAVAREEIHMPVDTPAIQDAAPYTSFSSGTQTAESPWMRPRLWAPPASTAMSDATMAAESDTAGQFASDGWA